MKNAPLVSPRFAAAVAGLLGTAIVSVPAQAAGVVAGTLIQNTATATFTSGTSTGSIQSNTVTVKVDELLDVSVSGLTTGAVTTASGEAILAYSLTNTGNGPEAFVIGLDPAVAGNAFDVTVQSIFADTNGNGSYDPGVDQPLGAGATTALLAPDTSLKLFVVVSLPADAGDGETSQLRLTADAATGTGAPGTVFAGQGDGGGDAVAGASGGTGTALDSVLASLASVSLLKTATIADPFRGTQPVPGATVTYTLVATVSGTGSANGLHITDIIPAGTTYMPGSLTLEGIGLSDGADSDAGIAGASGIDVTIGTAPTGTSKTVTFAVTIN